MDADTRTLIERTRQRREILNQRFAGMPEAAPRKRRTPVLENEASEKKISGTVDQDEFTYTDSPKRQCLRDVEINVKPDTPAIRGIQSRIKDLKPGENIDGNGGGDMPTPRPRKSVSSPPPNKKSTSSPNPKVETPAPSSARKSRFAALAQSINNWEDDMTHHVVHKEEEKKPRWQPPQNIGNTSVTPKKDPSATASETKASFSPAKLTSDNLRKSFKENRCASPAKNAASPAKANQSQDIHNAVAQSPKKTRAPPVPENKAPGSPASALARNSPLRASKVEWNRSPKPFSSTFMSSAVSPSKAVIKPVASPKAFIKAATMSASNPPKTSESANLHYTADKIPVNAPGLLETPPTKDLNKATGEPTHLPVSQRFAAWNQKTSSPEPSKQPLSTKLSNFEQKISQNTPRHALAGTVPIPNTPKQTPVSSFSASTPASNAIFASTKTPLAKSNVNQAKVCDPSELPVSQRMSQMQQQLTKKHQDEPTAYSVNARMSAWEDMTSANKVCDVKKVDPGQTTPFGANRPRPTSAFTPRSGLTVPASTPKSASAPITLTSSGPPTPPPQPAIKSSHVVESKSLKESIEAKAAEVSRRTGLQYTNRSPMKLKADENASSPTKAVTHSPKKVSAGTKGVQQLLAERSQENTTTCSQMAAQSRAARAAELAALSNRFKNGILRDDALSGEEVLPPSEQAQEQAPRIEVLTPGKDKSEPRTPATSRKEAVREKARADFNSKLAELEMDDASKTLFSEATKKSKLYTPASQKVESAKSSTATASIYSLVKKRDEAITPKPEENKRVKFNDSFDDSDDEPDRKIPKSAAKRLAKTEPAFAEEDTEVVFKKPENNCGKEDADSVGDNNSDQVTVDRNFLEVSDDDISLRGFVSEATRRESIFGRPQPSSRTSGSSLDSYDCSTQATDDNEEASKTSSGASVTAHKAGYQPDDDSLASDEDNSSKRKAVNDLLDDAFDDTMDEEYDLDMDPNNVVMRKKQPHQKEPEEDYDPDMDINNVVMRRKPNHASMYSTDDDDDRPYSLAAYRKSATINQHMMAPVVRSSKYVGKQIEEENIPMPYVATEKPHVDDRRAVQDRIKELKELVQQEQSVIMQTSNALNKCCVGNPMFAGSSEQVECNRVLLLACQKRQCYMTEIERLKATGQLSAEGPGPQGSLTISDIRLPLKRDFVTKIGTSHDTTTHYFILLIRNGAQLICTQMLSTHDPMIRGSLDFPNLIKINGITGNFKLTLDIYGMSVSREVVGKDKKKKTPKKQKGLVLESPGGPRAVRTTSFSHVTSLELTRKMLDKSSFHLDRLSYLSPLYGQIYMRLKCLMESNVEERGFLTMFDDVSGFGAWHRRWCVLTGNKLCIWKYPDDETRKDPMAVIDLKRCVSEKVGLVSRDVCARPNTFELVIVRQPLKGEHDTLVTRTHKSSTSVKYLMSADSKEERIVWCNKVNRTLANLRTWNADALKPMRPPGPQSGASSSRR